MKTIHRQNIESKFSELIEKAMPKSQRKECMETIIDGLEKSPEKEGEVSEKLFGIACARGFYDGAAKERNAHVHPIFREIFKSFNF